MLEIMFATILVIAIGFGALCIVEHSAKLRKLENDRFLKKYEKLYLEAERQRSAKEMAACIMVIERECKRKPK